jgi:hypothetical protein
MTEREHQGLRRIREMILQARGELLASSIPGKEGFVMELGKVAIDMGNHLLADLREKGEKTP